MNALPAFMSRDYFERLKADLMGQLSSGQHLYLSLAAEQTQFIRINGHQVRTKETGARIRQIGTVEEALLTCTYIHESAPGILHRNVRTVTLCGDYGQDWDHAQSTITYLKTETPRIRQDLFAKLPERLTSSEKEQTGKLLSIHEAPEALLSPIASVDLAGIYSSGKMVRAMANSAGLLHWFSTDTFNFDYSLFTPSQRAVKATYSGTHWDTAAYAASITLSQDKLKRLDHPARKLGRGSYRAYLEPAAVHDLVNMFSWNCIGEASIQQGLSPLKKLRGGQTHFSKKFSLSEDFSRGDTPRFNEEGALAQEKLALIQDGRLTNALISSRSAKEYGLTPNGASANETMRSPSVKTGSLKSSDMLKRLGTGLYLSNLHYLNWSDPAEARITGMTRYACFYVENGEIIEPIENMRFDDTLFSLLGDALEEVSDQAAIISNTDTYGMRSLGSAAIPGILVSEMKLTL
ncbi:MAG: TldD/PmbA family protein [Methylotenera sp.]|nr:TldD/PmbA family protein [Oligoflexia bacterium]